MDIQSAEKVVEGLDQGLIKLKQINSGIPSPFAWNIAMQGYMDIMKMEDRLEFIKRMHKQVQEKIKEKS